MQRLAPSLPPPKTSSLLVPKTIAAGTTFDGGNVRFDRGAGACEGQKESGDSAAVFLVQDGATVQNVVIGADQAEACTCFCLDPRKAHIRSFFLQGIHCLGMYHTHKH